MGRARTTAVFGAKCPEAIYFAMLQAAKLVDSTARTRVGPTARRWLWVSGCCPSEYKTIDRRTSRP